MSTFLIHQEQTYAVLLADSLGTKGMQGTPLPVAAPKLVLVAPCVYAVHAGTWQPALEMLSRLRELLLASAPEALSWQLLQEKLKGIGCAVYEHYQGVFGLESFDVRVALLLTGTLRHHEDQAAGRSSTLVVWEAARGFEPTRTVEYLHFGGSKPLSDLATTILTQDFVRGMLKQSPLACAQALVATHAALAKLSTNISPEANVVVCGTGAEHTVIHGTLLELPQTALIRG